MAFTNSLIKNPGAWVPIIMSASALAFTLAYLAMFGVAQQPAGDEGTAARIFQLLMAGQLPIIAFFAIKYLPKKPIQTIQVLVLQFAAGFLAFAPILFFEL